MSLYYEDFPADDGAEPQLPPLLTAVQVPSGQNVMAKALASGATAEVGTVFYSEDNDVTDIALVLGPEVPLRKAGQMLYAMMIGVGDAIGALAPPEVIVAYQLPGYVLLNRGRAGAVWIAADPAAGREDVPAWMALLGPELEELALASFAWDHRERARLLRDRWIEARNERVWSGVAETDGVACGRAEQEQVRITNRYRALLGRQSVAWDPLIQAAAAVHSDYMSRTGNFGHFQEDVPGRRTPFDRMREQGYDRGVSENCHAGSGSPEGAHQGWTHSSGHHRNLLMTGHTEMATAVAGPYWTQNFGMGEASRAELPPPPPAPWHD